MPPRRLWFCLALLPAAGCIGTDLVEEPPPAPSEAFIVVTPPVTSVIQGGTAVFQATYFEAEDRPVDGVSFEWISSDLSLASLDAAGQAATHRPGQVMIQARARGITSPPALLTIVADPTAVARVVLQPETVELAVNATQAFTATAHNLAGDVVTGAVFSWQSSDPTVASIDADGRATAQRTGTTRIRATTSGVTSAPAVVVVLGGQRIGRFQRRPGSGYTVQGTATLGAGADGRLVLSFGSDFTSSNGPGLEVFLSPRNAVTATSLKVGRLQATSGAQSYGLPREVGLLDYDWVIIHCVPFNVTFGYAELQ